MDCLKSSGSQAKRLPAVSYFSIVFLICLSFAATLRAEEAWDPLEPMNRGIFWFNDKADIYVIEPIASTYDEYLPACVKRKVTNFFSNLREPARFVSNLVQLKMGEAAGDAGRFLINTTVGVGGLFEVASELGLDKHDEDFGLALARYDVPAGPYLVLPFLGPSNFRDGVGRLVDGALDPTFYVGRTGISEDAEYGIIYGTKALQFVNTRAQLLDAVKAAKESSLDYYLFMQSAYYQYRRGQIYYGNPPPEEGEEFEGDTGESPGTAVFKAE